MNLVFQNPLWFIAALVGVPLLAHLFSRSRPRRREFPSLRLLREALRQVTRVRQPRDRWLLILRTLAMLALAAAFLQPWLHSRFASPSGVGRTVVLILDRTASMAYADGTRTRFAQAGAAAEDVLAALPSNSRANVVWLRAHPTSELPDPGPNLEFLRQALRQASVVPESGDLGAAFSLALRQLAEAPGDRELIVISDFQQSAWKDVEWPNSPGIRLTRIAIGSEQAANLAVAELAVEPTRPVIGIPAQVTCRVRNFSPEPRRTTVFAEVGESRLSTAVEVAPWGETLAVLPATFSQEGLVPMKASISEDRFVGDDVCYALADVRRALRVAVVGAGEDATATTWLRAARSLDGVVGDSITWPELEGGRGADVLLVAGWDGNHAPAMIEHLKRGSLVIQPGAGLGLNETTATLGLPGEGPLSRQEKEAPGWGLRVAVEDHPVFALFASGGFGDPFGARFARRIALAPATETKALLRFEDGGAALALADFQTGGQRPAAVLWWNLDLGASDWSTHSVFPIFFGEVVQYLGKRALGSVRGSSEPGEQLRFDASEAFTMAEVSLLDERDQLLPIAAESPRAPNRLLATQPAEPGSFRWMAQGSVLDRAVVSFPTRESDLRLLSAETLGRDGGAVIGDAARAHLSDLRGGKPLWAWCLMAGAAFLCIEGLLLRSLHRTGTVAVPGKANPGTLEQRERAEVAP